MTAKEQAALSLGIAHIRDALKDVEPLDEDNHQKLVAIRQQINAIIVSLSISDDLPA